MPTDGSAPWWLGPAVLGVLILAALAAWFSRKD